jgi:kynurenine formamidase
MLTAVMALIDLTMPVADHLRWKVERRTIGDFRGGDQFEITWVGWAVHGFTHVDAPRHMLPDGATTSDLPLARLVGPCAVVDLSDLAEPERPLDRFELDARGGHVGPGDIIMVKTSWGTVRSYRDARFWREAPYLTAEAALWLREREPAAVAFDFPQDYPIRLLLDERTAPIEEFVTHDVLLRQGIPLIEYLHGTEQLTARRTYLCALPLAIPDADGAPARVVALEHPEPDA